MRHKLSNGFRIFAKFPSEVLWFGTLAAFGKYLIVITKSHGIYKVFKSGRKKVFIGGNIFERFFYQQEQISES